MHPGYQPDDPGLSRLVGAQISRTSDPMLCNSASGPEIGRPVLDRLDSDRESLKIGPPVVRRPGRRADVEVFRTGIRPKSGPISGPEALLRNIGVVQHGGHPPGPRALMHARPGMKVESK